MVTKKTVASVKANQGERMIEIRIRFWTNDIADGKGNILPKHAWSGGMVHIERNKSHGIIPKKPVPFHTLMDLSAVVEKVLISHGIVLRTSRKMKKYMEISE